MKLSAGNQFPGVVSKADKGAVKGIVTIGVNGTPVSAAVCRNAIHEPAL